MLRTPLGFLAVVILCLLGTIACSDEKPSATTLPANTNSQPPNPTSTATVSPVSPPAPLLMLVSVTTSNRTAEPTVAAMRLNPRLRPFQSSAPAVTAIHGAHGNPHRGPHRCSGAPTRTHVRSNLDPSGPRPPRRPRQPALRYPPLRWRPNPRPLPFQPRPQRPRPPRRPRLQPACPGCKMT